MRRGFQSPLLLSLLAFLSRAALLLPVALQAQEAATRAFNLPADMAERTLKLHSQQSGRALIMSTRAVQGIGTNAVRGEYTPREALGLMLANTGLGVVEDPKSGSLAVRKVKDRNSKNDRKTTQLGSADSSDAVLDVTSAGSSILVGHLFLCRFEGTVQ